MTVTLTPDDESFVEQLILQGPFDDAAQVVATALIALRSACASQDLYRDYIAAEIMQQHDGLDAIEA